ncbi:hypothetical protein ACFOEK_10770 [Litoribrevibacter euphylliae]|uniref:Uncharacterized protein n=1 Tax=Litoribrevibacter euphylliae TaxID=1834034 RepID=A0ABV7HFL0_9GAMM
MIECKVTDLPLVVSSQIQLAQCSDTVEHCSPYFRQMLQEMDEIISQHKVVCAFIEGEISKVRDFLQAKGRPRHALKLEGLVLTDDVAWEFVADKQDWLESMEGDLKACQRVAEMLREAGF